MADDFEQQLAEEAFRQAESLGKMLESVSPEVWLQRNARYDAINNGALSDGSLNSDFPRAMLKAKDKFEKEFPAYKGQWDKVSGAYGQMYKDYSDAIAVAAFPDGEASKTMAFNYPTEQDKKRFWSTFNEVVKSPAFDRVLPDKTQGLEMLGERASRGWQSFKRAPFDFTAMIAGDSDIRAQFEMEQRAQSGRVSRDPAEPQGGGIGNTLARGALAGVESAPAMVGSAVLAAATGGASTVPQVAYWAMQISPGEYADMKSRGYGTGVSIGGALVSGTVQGFIENKVLGPLQALVPKKLLDGTKDKVMNTIRAVIADRIKAAGKEASEEVLQDAASSAVREAMSVLQEKLGGEDIPNEFWQDVETSVKQFPEYMAAAGTLMAPGTVAGIREVMRNPEQARKIAEKAANGEAPSRKDLPNVPSADERLEVGQQVDQIIGLSKSLEKKSTAHVGSDGKTYYTDINEAVMASDPNATKATNEFVGRTVGQQQVIDSTGVTDSDKLQSNLSLGRESQPAAAPAGEPAQTEMSEEESYEFAAKHGLGKLVDNLGVVREAYELRASARAIQQGGGGLSWRGIVKFDSEPSKELVAAIGEQLNGTWRQEGNSVTFETNTKGAYESSIERIQRLVGAGYELSKKAAPQPAGAGQESEAETTNEEVQAQGQGNQEGLLVQPAPLAEAVSEPGDLKPQDTLTGEAPPSQGEDFKSGDQVAWKSAAGKDLYGVVDSIGEDGAVRVRSASGILIEVDPESLSTSQPQAGSKADQAMRQIKSDIQKIYIKTQSGLGMNIDPELLILGGKVVGNALKLGYYKFEDFVKWLVNQVGSERAKIVGQTMRGAWEEARKSNPNMDAAGDIDFLVDQMELQKPPVSRPRPDLANPGSREARTVTNAVDAARTLVNEPVRFSALDLQKQIKDDVARDPESAYKQVMETGEDVSADAIERAKQTRDVYAQKAIQSQAPEDMARAVGLANAYRRVTSKAGGALQQARDFDRIGDDATPERKQQAIADALLEPTQAQKQALARIEYQREELKKRLDQAINDRQRQEIQRQIETMDGAEKKLLEQIAIDAKKLRDEIIGRGWKIDDEGWIKDNPNAIKAVIEYIKGRRVTLEDKLFFYWLNSILSGIKTFTSTFAGGTVFAAYELGPKRLAAALSKSIIGDKDSAYLGEFNYILSSTIFGLGRSVPGLLASEAYKSNPMSQPYWKLARQLWAQTADGRSFLEMLGREDEGRHGKTSRPRGATPLTDALWKFTAYPTRMISFLDQLVTSAYYNATVSAHAYRLGRDAGLDGTELEKFMIEQVNNPNSQATANALSEARRITFNQEAGKITQAINQIKQVQPSPSDSPGSAAITHAARWFTKFSFPLVRIGVAVFSTGIKMTDPGVRPLWAVINAWRTGRWEGISDKVADSAMAWALFLTLLATNDPDDPWITGTTPLTRKGQRELDFRTHQPMTIKIGNERYDYSRYEPFATVLGLAVDLTDKFRETEKIESLAGAGLTSLTRQLQNKTFLQGLGDIMRVTQAQSVPEAMGRGLSTWLSSWVPNIWRDTMRSIENDYTIRDVPSSPDKAEYWNYIFKRMAQNTQLPQRFGMYEEIPAYDLWGRPISRNYQETSLLWKLVSPSRAYKDDIFIGDRILLNYNANRSELEPEIYPVSPDRKFLRVDGRTGNMTDEQFSEFQRQSGNLAKLAIEKLNLDDSSTNAEVVRDAVTMSRDVMKDAMQGWFEGKDLGKIDMNAMADYVVARTIRSEASGARRKPERPTPFASQSAYERNLEKARREREKSLKSVRELTSP